MVLYNPEAKQFSGIGRENLPCFSRFEWSPTSYLVLFLRVNTMLFRIKFQYLLKFVIIIIFGRQGVSLRRGHGKLFLFFVFVCFFFIANNPFVHS